jgi:hypothetical protein
VIHKAYPGGNPGLAPSVNVQLQIDVGLPGLPINFRFPHHFCRHCILLQGIPSPIKGTAVIIKKLLNKITIIIFFFIDISNSSPFPKSFYRVHRKNIHNFLLTFAGQTGFI